MRYTLFIICILCLFSHIQAFDRVYTPALSVDAGDTLTRAELPADLNSLTINYRISCKKIRPTATTRKLWNIIWCKTSEQDYYEAEISCGCNAYGSVVEEPTLIIDVRRYTGGIRNTIHTAHLTKGVSTSRGANSINIDLWNDRIYVRAGNGNAYTDVCDFSFEPPSTQSKAALIAYEDIELLRERISAYGKRETTITDSAKISRRLAMPDISPVEGYWFYYDRKMSVSKTNLGGYYSLAIIKSDNIADAYDIIYINGAETNAAAWPSGALKGRLYRSGFENEFDLEWFDSDRHVTGIENSASLTNQESTLLLNFPSLEAQLRFRRNPNRLLTADPE